MKATDREVNELATAINNNKIFGKRKLIFCSITTFLVFAMTFSIILMYGPAAGSIITGWYVLICVVIIGMYPAMNVISKFAHTIETMADKISINKLPKALNSVRALLNALSQDKDNIR